MNVETEARLCRVCLESNHINDLIAPCYCAGSSLYIHRNCLNQWRASGARSDAFTHCPSCKMRYVLIDLNLSPEAEMDAEKWRIRRYWFYVIRDFGAAILIFELLMFAFSFFLELCDSSSLRLLSAFPSWFSMHFSYWLWSHIIVAAIIGFLTLIFAVCSGTASTSSGGSSSNWYFFDDGEAAVYCFLIMLVILVCIGVFIGIFMAAKFAEELRQRHSDKLWKQQQTTQYVVKDFMSCRDQLPSRPLESNAAENMA